MFGGSLSASSAFSCSGVANSSNSCYTSHLSSFNTQLDWAVFGTPDGNPHFGVWTATSQGITINVLASATSQSTMEGLRTAVNYNDVFIGGTWQPAVDFPPQPYSFVGHFDAPPNAQPGSPIAPGSPGDHLMGLLLDGVNASGSLNINLSAAQTNLAFRLAAQHNSLFNATIQVFSGINQTGTLLDTINLTNFAGGGTCTSLISVNHAAPVPCNDAPFVGFLATTGIRSLSISSNDATGLYLGNLMITTPSAVPEPTPLIFCGCGLALLIIGKKRWRRS
jgi:hypothetical protein